LIRNDPAAGRVAETMGKAPAVVVSVNGAVTAQRRRAGGGAPLAFSKMRRG